MPRQISNQSLLDPSLLSKGLLGQGLPRSARVRPSLWRRPTNNLGKTRILSISAGRLAKAENSTGTSKRFQIGRTLTVADV